MITLQELWDERQTKEAVHDIAYELFSALDVLHKKGLMPEEVSDGSVIYLDSDNNVTFGFDPITIETDLDLTLTMIGIAHMAWEVATMGTARYENDEGDVIYEDDIEYPGRFALDERRRIYADLHPILLKVFRRELKTPDAVCELLKPLVNS